MLAGRPRGLAGQPKLAGRVGKSHTARAPSVFARSPAAQHLWTGQIRPNWIRARGGGRAGRGGEALAKPAELANANARLPCHCCVALSARLSSPLLSSAFLQPDSESARKANYTTPSQRADYHLAELDQARRAGSTGRPVEPLSIN